MPGAWIPPEGERALGLGLYITTEVGGGGPLKERSEDFRVTEISAYPPPDPSGEYVILRVRSQDWEQHELAQRIAQRLGLAPHALRWAGTKDRRAVAERLLSYRGALPAGLDLAGVELLDAYRARDGLALGHHYGNYFDLRVAPGGLSPEELARRYAATRRQLQELGGFPNFFGLQRFGEVRPVTHLVGAAIARGDLAAAVELYLTAEPGAGEGPGAVARREYAQHHDPARALREFPPHFRFERTLLEHLARGQPPARALRGLSHELRTLFVHAYQSLLFNRWLSRRLAAGLPLDRPEEGDLLVRVGRDGTPTASSPIPVARDNLVEATEMVGRGQARVAGPIVGFETPRLVGRPGALLEEILHEEGIERSGFEVPAAPDLASAGTVRAILVPTPPIEVRPEAVATGTPAARPPGIWLGFALPKGAYATVLVREFTKFGAVWGD